MNAGDHEQMVLCAAHLHRTLIEAARHRDTGGDWQAAEQAAMLAAVNEWADRHRLPRLTAVDVAQAESGAVGHCDYGSKFAWFLAESLYRGR